jgi:hypothetical protein
MPPYQQVLNNTWTVWVGDYYGYGGGTGNTNYYGTVGTNNLTTISSQIWNGWVETGTTGGTYYPQLQQQLQPMAWTTWNNSYVPYSAPLPAVCDRPLTKEQAWSCAECNRPLTYEQHLMELQAARRKECEQRRRTIIASNRKRSTDLRNKLAERRADLLLQEHLTAEQRAEWTKDRAFHIETADGRRRYRLAYGLSYNVKLVKCATDEPQPRLRSGQLREGVKLCAHVYHPEGHVPHADNVLAQKLMLETNEEQFLAMANAGWA